jgi:hypothetical protein
MFDLHYRRGDGRTLQAILTFSNGSPPRRFLVSDAAGRPVPSRASARQWIFEADNYSVHRVQWDT